MVLHTTTTMSGTSDVRSTERQNLLTRLLDAVKQCQVRFGGRSELATESDSRVSCLCSAWEAALQHGMKHSNKALATIKQVTQITGITKLASGISVVDDIKNMETEPAFWHYVKEHLNKHEVQRFMLLKNISTDAGRGRAWLRSTFNEHSLEKYMHMLLENDAFLKQYYEDWALLRDMERSSMMPMMAAGLGSILFAIGIDNSELNTIKPATGLDVILNTPSPAYAPRNDAEPMPVIAGETSASSPQEKRKIHKKKKKIANIVSFEEDDEGVSSSPGSSITSPSSGSTRSFDLGVHSVRSGGRRKEGFSLATQGTLTVGSLPSHGFTTNKTHMRNSSMGSLDYGKKTEGAVGGGGVLPRQASTSSLPINASQSTSLLPAARIDANTPNVPIVSQVNSGVPSNQQTEASSVLDSKGSAIHKQTSNDSSKSDGSGLIPHEETASRKAYAFSSGYATQSSDSSQDLPPGGAAVDDSLTLAQSDQLQSENNSTKMQTELLPLKGFVVGKDPMDLPLLDTGAIVSELLATNESAAPLVPLSPDGAALDPFLSVKPASDDSISYDSGDLPSYNEDIDNATYALTLAQQGLSSSGREQRTQGDGSYAPEPALSQSYDSMSTEDLRQAIVAMMLRKDEVEENNKWLRCALEVEQDTVNAQKLHLDELKKEQEVIHERDASTIQAITKENELLKHQLRKYVSAVQMLRSQAGKVNASEVQGIHLDDLQPAMPPPKPSIDYSHEASEYERKLIQVAEMHGELMEFSDMLHRQLNAREALLKQYKQELIELRGPLPEDMHGDDEMSHRSEDFDFSAPRDRSLISVWIPSAFLRGTGSDAYHVYQVYIRIRDEEWNIYRRYTEFLDLHNKIKKIYPVVSSYPFPPKKAIGNKDARFVEARRKKMQEYIRQVINYLCQNHPQFTVEISRAKLVQVVPFFGDQPKTNPKQKSKKDRKSSAKAGPSDSGASSASTNSHYMGL